MRTAFCESLVAEASHPQFVFLSGDLGFSALEPLVAALGKRFINAGVAEQNMVSASAGLARSGLRPWAYSIAPFIYARPFEQVRNDVCLHGLPVVLVGNGGGYGYGVMGATHHALEDYGILCTLPSLRVYLPAFDSDVPQVIQRLFEIDHPAYLRLGNADAPADLVPPPFSAWRKLLEGGGPTMLVAGPLVGGLWATLRELDDARRPTLWLVGELPLADVPEEFLEDVDRSQHLLVVEEHVAQGGVGQMIAHTLMRRGRAPRRFNTRNALGYPSGLYGSQKFHRGECRLDASTIAQQLASGDF